MRFFAPYRVRFGFRLVQTTVPARSLEHAQELVSYVNGLPGPKIDNKGERAFVVAEGPGTFRNKVKSNDPELQKLCRELFKSI